MRLVIIGGSGARGPLTFSEAGGDAQASAGREIG